MKLRNLMTEAQYDDRVCKCNKITRGVLLKQSSFNPNNSPEEIIKSMMDGGCGCCIKSLEDWKESSCKDKQELKVHYSEVIN